MSASVSEKLMAHHPLQRLKSPSRGASALLHTLGLASFTFSFWYLFTYPTVTARGYGAQFQFLTNIGLVISMSTFVVGLLADITLSPRLFMIKNMLSMCCAPLEVLISLLFWSLFWYDKSLLMPPEVLRQLNPWANFSFHASPSILLTLDTLFFSPPWTIHALPAMGLSSIIAFGYWFWVEHCKRQNGWYVYPLFGVLSMEQRIVLFTLAASLMTGCTILLKWLYGRVNGLQGSQRRATPANIKGE